MKSFYFLLCIAYASCYHIADNNNKHPVFERIVQGDFARIEDVPYQASLLWFNIAHNCGASIIHESWVLTAAHCVENKTHFSVRTGTAYRKMFGTKHKVQKIIMHPDYETKSNDNDIALLQLEEPIKFTEEQKAIPIANSSEAPKQGDKMKISGFGKIGERLSSSNILKVANVPVVNQQDCAEAYAKSDPLTDNMFCAGDGTTDSCGGDSGGPGVINGKLYGVISSGKSCASKIYPGIYTRVHKYYDWIVKTTGVQF